jgi:hypothetical protein
MNSVYQNPALNPYGSNQHGNMNPNRQTIVPVAVGPEGDISAQGSIPDGSGTEPVMAIVPDVDDAEPIDE